MDISGQQIILVDRGFLREPSVKETLEGLEYRGFSQSFEDFWVDVETGEATSAFALVGEILDATHPHIVQIRLRGKHERVPVAIPWARIQGFMAPTEPQRAKLGVRAAAQF